MSPNWHPSSRDQQVFITVNMDPDILNSMKCGCLQDMGSQSRCLIGEDVMKEWRMEKQVCVDRVHMAKDN